ncbi:small nuclear RNA activating complex, subunit SNAP43-domain-containing protein [Mycotypha africana]|uniref:small nuclear RNA activating complex, subunit SNAP43-domain-containing protein n=1 Tax=Mycotypha africana TaxID=64632 RepID=UPI002301BEBE|nr:small nuclear RNA activating complex, subunit SNAP43-domain-containing protein [Mycotypha africana]KAI8979523.1 small nuclear RNA activating complex, subunit SNAP43-domain-containing protein [Mycotypha africana]
MNRKGPKPKNRVFPSTSNTVANLVRVAKNVGIDRQAIEDDVEYLLYHFISKPNQSFSDFDDLWNELHFNYVHFACLKREFRESYLNAFFTSFLDHFSSPLPSVKCAVLFSLYFLYISQPSVWGKMKIRVTKDIYNALFQFYYESILKEKHPEAALIFEKLRDMEAFCYVAEQEPETHHLKVTVEFEKSMNLKHQLRDFKRKLIENDPLHYCFDDSSRLKNEFLTLANQYQKLKEELFCTPQATIATQHLVKQRLNVNEKRPKLLRKVLLNSDIAQNETEILKRITRTGQQMLNTKRRRLQEKKSSF